MSAAEPVECYASSSYPQEARAVHWQGQRLLVAAIEARWRQPDGFGFRLRCEDGQCFEALYLVGDDCWRVQPV